MILKYDILMKLKLDGLYSSYGTHVGDIQSQFNYPYQLELLSLQHPGIFNGLPIEAINGSKVMHDLIRRE